MTLEVGMLMATSGIAIYYYFKYREMVRINRDVAAFVALLMASRTEEEVKDGNKVPF